jgi:hypothetical protein
MADGLKYCRKFFSDVSKKGQKPQADIAKCLDYFLKFKRF